MLVKLIIILLAAGLGVTVTLLGHRLQMRQQEHELQQDRERKEEKHGEH